MSERRFSESDNAELRAIARKHLWWESSDSGQVDLSRLACQVMTFGTWSDVLTTRRILGDDFFRDSLVAAPAGVFDVRSWNYWHLVFGITPVPPLPRRVIP
jgi:hypothetical protein